MSLTADRRSTTPFIDAHSTVVAAPVDEVWRALLGSLERSFSKSSAVAYARLVGCADSRASGPRPVTTGSTVPGFRVTSTVPPKELVLEGQHRFASYVLTFNLVELGTGRSRLRAETRARFPGAAGFVYKLLVVGTHLHVLAVRRLLAGVRRGSEMPRDRDGDGRASPLSRDERERPEAP